MGKAAKSRSLIGHEYEFEFILSPGQDISSQTPILVVHQP
jgi:hypothetical protein